MSIYHRFFKFFFPFIDKNESKSGSLCPIRSKTVWLLRAKYTELDQKKKMLGKEVSESGGVSKKILKKEVLFQ